MTTLDTGAAARLLTDPVVATLAATFSTAGHQLLLVGGSIRDALTGDDVHDLDFTTDATPDQTRRLIEPLGTVWEAGSAFGTIGVSVDGEQVEITTFRAEQYDDGSRKPEVAYSTCVEDDLARRDLTINAIALDVVGGELVDPFDGAGDLARGILRCPGDPMVTMSEDPLRQVRVVRFAARTGFAIDGALRAAVVATRDRLAIVARERITAELRKIAACGPQATATAVQLATDLGIAEAVFGTFAGEDAVAALTRADDGAPVLAVLAYGRKDAEAALRQLKLSGEETSSAVGTAKLAADLVEIDPSDVVAVRRLARACRTRSDVADAAAVATAHGRDVSLAFQRVGCVTTDEPDVVAELPIGGHDLLAAGLSGPAIGRALRAAEAALLTTGSLDRDAALAAALAG